MTQGLAIVYDELFRRQLADFSLKGAPDLNLEAAGTTVNRDVLERAESVIKAETQQRDAAAKQDKGSGGAATSGGYRRGNNWGHHGYGNAQNWSKKRSGWWSNGNSAASAAGDTDAPDNKKAKKAEKADWVVHEAPRVRNFPFLFGIFSYFLRKAPKPIFVVFLFLYRGRRPETLL